VTDQSEQALAAVQIIRAQVIDHGASLASSLDQQFAVVRAALTPPPLPADLAEIQARADAAPEGPWTWRVSNDRHWALIERPDGDGRTILVGKLADDDAAEFIAHARTDVPALVAELAELRARPTLTAEQAHQLFIRLLGRTVEHEAWLALSAIARLHKPQ